MVSELPQYPPCPAEPWVVLAKVTLPASPSTPINDSGIDNITFRRQIYSTAVLQEQLIACCCGERPQPAASLKVANVRVLRTTDTGTEVDVSGNLKLRDNRPAENLD
jgi:hypothetical protein